jgi:hypothetical protein
MNLHLTKPQLHKGQQVAVVLTLALLSYGFIQQNQFKVVDSRTNPQIIITGDQAEGEYRKSFALKGNVRYENKQSKIVVAAEEITGIFRIEKVDGKEKDTPDNLKMLGVKSLEQEAEQAGVVSKFTVITNQVWSSIVDGSTSKITMPNGVKASRKSSLGEWIVTGRAAEIVTLRFPQKDQNSVTEMVLAGPVDMSGFQLVDKVANGDKSQTARVKQTFSAKADKFSYSDKGSVREIRMSGNLSYSFAEDDADASEMTGARTLILVLTEKNEVKSFKLSSDGPEKIKSVRRQSGKGS